MSRKCLTSWKSAFVLGGIFGTVLLLVGMNLMVGANANSDEKHTTSPTNPTQNPGKSRHLAVDGPVLIGLGALAIVVGSLVGCVQYFRLHKKLKKEARRETTNAENGDNDCNDNHVELDGAENDGYSMTPRSQMSLENTPPSTPTADIVGIRKHPLPKHKNIIVTSEINPMTIVRSQSPSTPRMMSESPSSPMPLLSPLETHFVFQALVNTNQDKSSSDSSSPVSIRGNNRSSWYISESPESHLVRADYNQLQCDSSPNMSAIGRSSPNRSSRISTAEKPRTGMDPKSDSPNPNLLHPDQAYYLRHIKREEPPSLSAAEIHRSHDDKYISQWHPKNLNKKAVSEQSSSYNKSNSMVSEDVTTPRQHHSDDSGYCSNKKLTKKYFVKSNDYYGTAERTLYSDDLPRRSLTKSRNASSSSSTSSERGSRTKRVTIAVSSGEDTVFEDVITTSRPQNPVPPKSPRPRSHSTGARHFSPRLSGRRTRLVSYPASHQEAPEGDIIQDEELQKHYQERYSNTPPSNMDILQDRNYGESDRKSKRTTFAYGQDYDWPERAPEAQAKLRYSYQGYPKDIHRNMRLPHRDGDSPFEYDENNDLSQTFHKQTKPYRWNTVEYESPREPIKEGEEPRMRHHSETLNRPKTWANGSYQIEDISVGNKHLSDLPEVHFPHTQSSCKRRQLPDLEYVKRRQSRGSSSSTTSATPSPGVEKDDTDDDNEWV